MKKENVEQAKKDGKIIVVGVGGAGMVSKKLIEAMVQSDMNMKKTGTIKL